MIHYTDTTAGMTPDHLQGFFTHWANPPTAEALLRILQGSDYIVLAIDSDANRVVGYITAITDGVSCAYIPHLEVFEGLRGQGIGQELVRRMLEKLNHLYMIDLMCDPELQPFYEKLGFRRSTGMLIRNYVRQRCD